MDLKEFPLSKRKKRYLLLIIDTCTRFIFLRALQATAMNTIATTLFSLFCEFGFPKSIQSDNGREFLNRIISELMTLSNINQWFITPYNPRANGIAERFIGTVANTIYKNVRGNDTQWDNFIDQTQYILNVRVSDTTKSTPFSLMFARRPNYIKDFNNETPRQGISEKELIPRLNYMRQVVYPEVNRIARNKAYLEGDRQPATAATGKFEIENAKGSGLTKRAQKRPIRSEIETHDESIHRNN
ncbi:Ribonuclease H-like domain-containing protein [Rozella allomycis CSF55]|uniref:Ribonuclease H-like domain-containing protein n=1 Tax=Rozella allomycis (strain CSF55) TaxID=988480 RepID=A0A075AP40_ROZAC|nr:Ribonuclease H-like domain-containing protein [Rozella allomycis CSF55]|eukprot:EPZ31714.1 Ribonuclease H-like domain-containing protein [Rozella allomycis CSF55]